jgi:hypothetical protein
VSLWAYYNEHDPQKAAWIRELIKAGVVAPGEVDERSIRDIRADDLKGFRQCHFFAGIAVWSYALRLAGWPDDREVWTGSCPCPSFSAAGKGQGFDDARHLWPAWWPSSASVALQSSLENRLRQRLDTAGGTLYPLIGKVRHTPLRRRYLHRQALVVRTSEKGCTGWPTPTNDDPNNVTRESGQFNSLVRNVRLCGWPTPNTLDTMERDGLRPSRIATNRTSGYLSEIAPLAGWATPAARDYRHPNAKSYEERGGGKKGEQLSQVHHVLAGWPTPTATDAIKQGEVSPRNGCMGLSEMLSSLRDIPLPMRLKVTGEMLTGSSAQMESGGPLKPEHSRWLMALPAVWDDCAVTAMQSMRKSRKPSSKRTSQSGDE